MQETDFCAEADGLADLISARLPLEFHRNTYQPQLAVKAQLNSDLRLMINKVQPQVINKRNRRTRM